MLKKMLIKIASDIVLEALLVLATKERDHALKKFRQSPDSQFLQDELVQWNSIIKFLEEMQQKGLPV